MPFYAVNRGRNPGVYTTWSDCQKEVSSFLNAKFKKFSTEEEAWAFVNSTTPVKQEVTDESYSSQHVAAPSSAVPKTEVAAKAMKSVSVHMGTSGANVLSNSAEKTISLGQVSALRTTLANIHTTMDHLKEYVETAERQVDEIQNSHKTKLSSSNEDEPPPKKQAIADMNQDDTCAEVYTDGCCFNNGNKGAVAGIGVYWGPGDKRNVSERLPGRPTNNRAEIHAACNAIRQAKASGITNLTIKTDSNFLINSITKWIHKWKKNGWKLVDGKSVINREDFEELDGLLNGINVNWVHVKAHQGIDGNEAADRLANEGARKTLV